MIPGRPLIPYVIATAGHIDHGKSALVKALTGTDPDRLPEEKRRGITIDLGFAHLRLPSPANVQPGVEYVVGIVDVPGHEHFVKNMVAGVGSIDAALLVVAADDGWMPQTEEHVQILRYLGVKRAVIALAKADLGDVDVAVGSVCEHLAQTPFKDAPIIATSTVTGGGIEELKRSIAQMLAAIAPQRDLGKPRLPVDRVFSLKGIGTVVTGTLTGGKLRTGQMVCIQPANVPARVRSIQTHNREVEAGEPGSRVALNLPDIHAVGDRGKRAGHGVGRGDVITVADLGPPTSLLDALVERFGEMPQSRALRSSTVVRIHHGSASVPARIYLLGGNRLEAPGQSLARFTLQTPIFAFVGDRFVIRDWAEQHTLGGGIVLDFPVTSARPRRPIAGSAAWQLLEARAAAPDDLGAFVRTQIERDGVGQRQTFLRQSRFSSSEITKAIDAGIAGGWIIAAGDFIVDRTVWSNAWHTAEAAIDEQHGKHPEQAGLSLADLRARLEPLDEELVGVLADALCRDGFVRDASTIRRRSHRPALPARLQGAGEKLRQQLSDHPFDPPSRKALCPDDLSHQALKFLLAKGEAIAISTDLVLSSECYAKAVESIRDYISSHGPATVSELKQVLGSSRRVMVPLLERLDREKVTIRAGDRRMLVAVENRSES